LFAENRAKTVQLHCKLRKYVPALLALIQIKSKYMQMRSAGKLVTDALKQATDLSRLAFANSNKQKANAHRYCVGVADFPT
jgi:hypothetical protein